MNLQEKKNQQQCNEMKRDEGLLFIFFYIFFL